MTSSREANRNRKDLPGLRNGGTPQLCLYANLWSLKEHPSKNCEWSLERKIVAIQEAGFGGFAWILSREHGRLARKYGLWTIGFVVASRAAELRPLLQRSIDAGARRINVHLGRHDMSTDEALRLTLCLREEARRLNIACDIETHRNTCTETPEKTRMLAAAYGRATGELLPLTWDFSHHAVVKHLDPPFWFRLFEDSLLIQHAQHFHFRPFNGHHCQVPVTARDGSLSPELKRWRSVLDRTFALWIAYNRDGLAVFACPELGPVSSGYGLTGTPDSWADARRLRSIIVRAWRKAWASRERLSMADRRI